MKKCTLISVMVFLSISVFAQKTIEISGKINGLGNESVVLSYRFESVTYFDTITAKNDVVSLKKNIDLPHPVWATLRYIGTSRDLLVASTNFFVDNGVNIVLEGDITDLFSLRALNSPMFDDIVKLREENRPHLFGTFRLNQHVAKHSAEISQDSMQSLRELMSAYTRAISENTERFIQNNKHSLYAAYLYTTLLFGKSVDEIEKAYNLFTEDVRNSVFGKQIHTFWETAKKTAPGAPAPNFTQKDIHGNIVTLEQFRGNYVMLVFWGSWCGPCRRSHPHLMELLAKYKDSPLRVVGFASDRDRNAWKKAIEDDKLDFIHCNLFDRLNDENVGTLYNVRFFPTKVIIDPQGKIITTIVGASDPQKAELETILKNAFGK